MKTTCQILIIVHLIAIFFICLHSDFHSTNGKPPNGFPGAVITAILVALMSLVYWGAGAFSAL